MALGPPIAWAGESALDGEWGGRFGAGEAVQVIVASGEVMGFFWNGDYRHAGPSQARDSGARIEFIFEGGAASFAKTSAGARLTVRQSGHSRYIDLKKD